MSSKNNPGAFDCYAAAHPNEEMFHLLGRDCMGGSLARLWASAREQTGEEAAKVAEARDVGARMDAWCRDLGKTPVDVLDLLPFEVLANAVQRRSGVVMMQVQQPGDVITVNCERARVPHLVLTGKQIAELDQLAGGEPECEISIAFGDATSHAGPGLYAWYSEYPDDGAHPLFDVAEEPQQATSTGA
jgi:hypothetical protein